MRLWRRMGIKAVLLRDTAFVYSATVVGGAIQFLVLIILARSLGPTSLGVVIVATTISGLIAAALEFGIAPVLVRYYAPLSKSEPDLWQAMTTFLMRLVLMAAGIIVALAFCVALVLTALSASSHTVNEVWFGFAIAAGTVLLGYCQGFLQAQRRFKAVAGLTTGLPILRLLGVGALGIAGALSLAATLVVYLLAVVAITTAAWWLLPSPRVPGRHDKGAMLKARQLALPYMRWTFVGRAAVAVQGRLDVLLLSALAGSTSTGVYGAAFQSASPLVMLATSVGEVSFPHLVARRTVQVRSILLRWLRWLPVAVLAGVLTALVGTALLPALLGADFTASVTPFQLLVIAFSIQVWLQPIGALLYATDRQRPAAALALLQTVAMLALDVVLIPVLGAVGPALAVLVVTLLSVPAMPLVVLRTAPRGPEEAAIGQEAMARFQSEIRQP